VRIPLCCVVSLLPPSVTLILTQLPFFR